MINDIIKSAVSFLKANLWLLVVIAVIGFFLGHGCGSDSVKPSGVDVKANEKVVQELALTRDTIRIKDSLILAERAAHRKQIDSLSRLRAASQDRARKAAENASYWQGVAKQADEVKDFQTGLIARDSIIAHKDVQLNEKVLQLQLADSTIGKLSQDLALVDQVNRDKTVLIDKQSTVITQLMADNKKLFQEGQDLRKKIKRKNFWGKVWGGVKVGVVAAAGFAVGTVVK